MPGVHSIPWGGGVRLLPVDRLLCGDREDTLTKLPFWSVDIWLFHFFKQALSTRTRRITQ